MISTDLPSTGEAQEDTSVEAMVIISTQTPSQSTLISEGRKLSACKEDIVVDVALSTEDSQETSPQIGSDSEEEKTERMELAGSTTEQQAQDNDAEGGNLFVATEAYTSKVMIGTDLEQIAETENEVDLDKSNSENL